MQADEDRHLRAKVNSAIQARNEGNTVLAQNLFREVVFADLVDVDVGLESEDVLKTVLDNIEYLFGPVSEEYMAILRVFAPVYGQSPAEFDTKLMNILQGAGIRPKFSDMTLDIHPRLGRKVLIACQPKSGSTFLLHILNEVTKFSTANSTFAYGSNDQQPYLPFLLKMAAIDTISQEHYRATLGTVQLLEVFNFNVIVLVRNIFDALVSMRDMLINFGDTNTTLPTDFGPHLGAMNETEQLDAIIAKFAFWTVDFYASWDRTAKQGHLSCQFLRYEDMMADKVGEIQKIMDFCHMDKASPEMIEQSIIKLEGDKSTIRFNKGESGRGMKLMNEQQIEYIRSLPRFYPDVDFSRIGL